MVNFKGTSHVPALLGSVAEKVLRGTKNPLLLVRATNSGRRDGEAILKSLIVPLDGSPLAEKTAARSFKLLEAY